MKCLSESERKEAIELITDLYFDSDVIVSVRSLLQKQRQKEKHWKREFQAAFPPAEMEDTQPFTPVFDGD